MTPPAWRKDDDRREVLKREMEAHAKAVRKIQDEIDKAEAKKKERGDK